MEVSLMAGGDGDMGWKGVGDGTPPLEVTEGHDGAGGRMEV